MNFIVDIVIILAAVGAVYLGIVRGFVRSVMGFVSLLLAIVVSVIFTPTVSQLLCDNFISDRVSAIVSDSLFELISAGEQRLDLSRLMEDRPEALEQIAVRFGCDLDKVEEYYTELTASSDSEAIGELSARITEPTSRAIGNVAAAIGVFLAALILLKLITLLLDLICRLPVLRTLNTLLGLLFGLCSAALSALLIANASVALIHALNAIDPGIFNQSVIDDSIILRLMVERSLIFIK